MQSANAAEGVPAHKQWPDFYSILGASPDADSESLRRSINALYVKANEGSDHRELSTRFYNQVLSQKVLPQCRRILLNDHSRQAYNRQWHLHREGDDAALSYPDFIREITKGSGSAGGLLLSDEEISILPSVRGASHDPLVALKIPAAISETAPPPGVPTQSETSTQPAIAKETVAGEVIEGEEVLEPESEAAPRAEPLAVSLAGRPIIAQAQTLVVTKPAVLAVPRPKAFPLVPAIAGVLLLGIGAFAWNATRKPAPTPESDSSQAKLGHLYTLARNPDFEVPKMASWVVSGGFAGNEPSPKPTKEDAVSGNTSMTFFSKKPYNIDVRQTITALKPGKYTLRAWGKQGTSPKTAEMFVEGYGGSKRTIALPKGWAWKMMTIKDIGVTSGQATIGFNFESSNPKGGVGNVDAVEFFHQ